MFLAISKKKVCQGKVYQKTIYIFGGSKIAGWF